MSCVASVRRVLRASKRVRSTKGASKARRDHINAEIRTLRSLLPISAEDQERLSYLHSMSLICTFVRKSVLLSGAGGGLNPSGLDPSGLGPSGLGPSSLGPSGLDPSGLLQDRASPLYQSFLEALPGFIVALTRDGKLVYVSENVQEYLGLSMVDVLQGDSFYDMMDARDAEAVKEILREQDVSAESSFVCRMHSSRALRLQNTAGCSMLVRGRLRADGALFVALCSPTADRLKDSELLRASACFQTLHRPDMRLTHAPRSVSFHLGFSAEELIGRSWYELLHPEDLAPAADCHRILNGGEASAEMLVRLQRRNRSWIRLYVCASSDPSRDTIVCTNHVISEAEAVYLREKLYGADRSSQPARVQKDSDPLRMDSGPAADPPPLFFSSPPYSPTSSQCSSDFLCEGFGALCPPPPLPDRSSDPFSPELCPAEAHLVPVYGVCEALEDFAVFLTPEPSPPAEGPLLYSEEERAEIGTLARQIRSLASSLDAYSRTRPALDPGALCWPEPPLDEALIDCILSDCGWGRGRGPMEPYPCMYAAPSL
ncbi:neuronal PAS domain-containing protein 4-like [Puntigrus tetrazona]|uniref:neuronal PAS domain-containing protein 4-like n=1 Tax=Puntigrus tetrazona TaxID=1606681 RepID=UPI001C89BAF1|nr:neuronal PAS domain-containing protein 4-like [Puntigrus tetrazona]